MNLIYQSIFYDINSYPNIYEMNYYLSFIKNIVKNHITENKLIYEKYPKSAYYKKKEKLNIDRNRFITEDRDYILLFLASSNNYDDNTDVVMVSYTQYGVEKHVSIHPGKAIIIDPYKAFIQSLSVQSNSLLYTSIVCDFKYYNIPKFIRLHDKNSYNLNFNYGIM